MFRKQLFLVCNKITYAQNNSDIQGYDPVWRDEWLSNFRTKIRLPYSKLKKNNFLGCFILGERKCVFQYVGNHSPSFPASRVIRTEPPESLL